MKAVRPFGLFVMMAALLVAATAGCGGGDEGKKRGRGPRRDRGGDGGAEAPASKPLQGKGTGTVVGKVVYEGSAPAPKPIAAMDSHENAAVCRAGKPFEKVTQNLFVGPGGGVANAVIYVEPPDGFYFPADAKQKGLKGEFATIDQPHCAFIPHVVAFHSEYYDPEVGEFVPTGKKLKVLNSAPIGHNVKLPKEGNYNIPSGQSAELPQINSRNAMPMRVECSIHGWMNAYIWAMDTPYFAVTKEDGSFEIKGVPAGAKVRVFGWHEGKGYLEALSRDSGKEIEIGKDGDKLDLGTIKIN